MFLKSGYSFILITFQEGYRNIFLLGGSFFGTYLSVILWLAGYKYTLAGRAAIYNQLSTVLISIMAVYFLKDTLTKKKKIGILLSFIGAVIVSLD
jgi:drug/metabolite transporter (DMT)-like permease